MKRATLLLAAMLAALPLACGAALAAPKSVDPNTLTPPPSPRRAVQRYRQLRYLSDCR